MGDAALGQDLELLFADVRHLATRGPVTLEAGCLRDVAHEEALRRLLARD